MTTRRRGLDYQPDPDYVYVMSYADHEHYARRETLTQLHRIERLRQRTLSALLRLHERFSELQLEIAKRKEAFIPVECYAQEEGVSDQGGYDDGEDDGFFTQPRRLVAIRDTNGRSSVNGWFVIYDYDYWVRPKIAIAAKGASALADLAEVGGLLDWELECARRRAAIPRSKYELGRRYYRLEMRIESMRRRRDLLDKMLDLGVCLTELIDTRSHERETRHVNVDINGRLYQFRVSGGHVTALPDIWPWAGREQIIQAPAAFHFDDSLLGRCRQAVRIRLGTPDEIIDEDVWVYGKRAVRFAEDRVTEFLHDKEISVLRRSPARGATVSKRPASKRKKRAKRAQRRS